MITARGGKTETISAQRLFHGTARAVDKLEPQFDACLDCGGGVGFPVLFLTPDYSEAEFYSRLSDGGCGLVDAPESQNPRIWRIDVESPITEVDDDEFKTWMWAVEDDDPAAFAVRCTGNTYAARGTVVVRVGADYTAELDR